MKFLIKQYVFSSTKGSMFKKYFYINPIKRLFSSNFNQIKEIFSEIEKKNFDSVIENLQSNTDICNDIKYSITSYSFLIQNKIENSIFFANKAIDINENSKIGNFCLGVSRINENTEKDYFLESITSDIIKSNKKDEILDKYNQFINKVLLDYILSSNNQFLKDNYLKSLLSYGLTLKYLNRIHDSIEIYDLCLKINPNLSNIYFYKALALSEVLKNSKEKEEIKALYKKGLFYENEHIGCLFNLGNLYKQENDIDKSSQYYEKVIELDIMNIQAYKNLIDNYIIIGRYEKGIDLTSKYIHTSHIKDIKNIRNELNKDMIDDVIYVLLKKSHFLIMLKEYKESMEILNIIINDIETQINERLNKHFSKTLPYFYISQCLINNKEYIKAIDCLKKGLLYENDHLDSNFLMGNCYFHIKDYTQAINFYDKTIFVCEDIESKENSITLSMIDILNTSKFNKVLCLLHYEKVNETKKILEEILCSEKKYVKYGISSKSYMKLAYRYYDYLFKNLNNQ